MGNSRLRAGLAVLACSIVVNAQQYAISGRIPLEGDSGWDYLFADSANGQLYVSHGTEVDVVDLASEKSTGKITGMKRIHGIAVTNDLNRGFISDGGDDAVVIFDLKSHAVLQKVPAGKNPDGILYDPYSRRVFAFNGRSNDVTAIDVASGKVAGTIALDGKPEFPVSDGKGNVYVNIEDKNILVTFDATKLKLNSMFKLAPCEEPTGLAMDRESKRLIVGCGNRTGVMVDAETGKVLQTFKVGGQVDGAAFDARRKLAYVSSGEGILTILAEEPSGFQVLQDFQTVEGSRTLTVDEKTGTIFLPMARFELPGSPDRKEEHPRPVVAPGSFALLVVGKDEGNK